MFRLTFALAFALLIAVASAQNPAPAPAPLPATVRLQYPNADINTILDLYETLTRKRLIRPNQVLVGQLYIVINEDVPREEAIKIIEITLLANGFSFVPSEDPSIVKVFGNGVNPRTGGIPIISDASQLPEREQVVTYLFKLKYADPTELSQMLTGYVAPATAGYTSIVPLPKAQALLVTESTPIIRGLVKIVNEVDLPPAEVVSEFIQLKRADAKDVLEKLEKIFEKQPSTTGGTPTAPGGAPRPNRPATTPEGTPIPANATAEQTGANSVEINGGSSTLTEDSIIIGKIKLTADTRTNRIHVVTRPVNIKFVRTLLEEFDRDVPFGEPAERPLRFVTAADVLESVIKAIQDPGAKDDAAATGGAGTQGNRQGTTSNRNTSQGNFGNDRFGGNSNGSFGSSGGSGFSEELSTQQVDTVPRAVTVGNTRVIADTRANKIIVLGNSEVRDKIFKLLDRLDVRAPQVMIQAVIGQLELGANEKFSVDYILRKGGALNSGLAVTGTGNSGAGSGSGGVTGTASNGIVTFNGNTPTLNLGSVLNQNTITQIATGGASGLTAFFTAGNTLNGIVTALEATNRFRVSARPHVFASNNKKAIIASGQEIAVPTQTLTSLTNTNVAQDNAAVSSSIQYKKVALQLEVVPLINSEREVTLDILQKIDEVSGSTKIGGNDIPSISTRYIKTTVSVPNEATLILGGLIRQSDNNSKSGIPVLSRLPLLGALFRSTTKDKVRNELVILMRPVVAMNPEESTQVREREQEHYQMEPDIDASIYPKGIRRGASSELPLRTPALPVLRDRALAPTFR